MSETPNLRELLTVTARPGFWPFTIERGTGYRVRLLYAGGASVARSDQLQPAHFDPDVAALIVAGISALRQIDSALADYHLALDNREHGGVAQDRLVKAVEAAFGRHWQQGAETARRAQVEGDAT